MFIVERPKLNWLAKTGRKGKKFFLLFAIECESKEERRQKQRTKSKAATTLWNKNLSQQPPRSGKLNRDMLCVYYFYHHFFLSEPAGAWAREFFFVGLLTLVSIPNEMLINVFVFSSRTAMINKIRISACPGGEENRKQSAVSVDSRMDFFFSLFFASTFVAQLVRASRLLEKHEKQRILRANQFTIEPAVFTDKMFFFARCYRRFIHRHKYSYFALIYSSLYNVLMRNAPVRLNTNCAIDWNYVD